MDNLQTPVQAGGTLAQAVDRLDKAMLAVEHRLSLLQNPDAVFPADGVLPDVLLTRELEDTRTRERAITEAANGAFEALGEAAASIRKILSEETPDNGEAA